MLVIGEKINATNKTVAAAIVGKDEKFIRDMARSQADAGADFIDINAGIGHGSQLDEVATMEWLVELVQSATDKPLCMDSDNPVIVEAALRKYRGDKLLINSVTAESGRLEAIGSLAVEHHGGVIALAMGAEGIPDNVEQRLDACRRIMEYLVNLGVAEKQVFFDPLVLPISVDSRQGMVTLNTLTQIKSRYPAANTVMGLSNVSYGLPKRNLINQAFLVMAAHAGLDAVILDPLDAKLMSFIKVADALTGRDPSCRKYLRANRKGAIVD